MCGYDIQVRFRLDVMSSIPESGLVARKITLQEWNNYKGELTDTRYSKAWRIELESSTLEIDKG